MGECRRVLIGAWSRVRPFGAAWHAIAMVTVAIDALALFMTGRAEFDCAYGSMPTSRDPVP